MSPKSVFVGCKVSVASGSGQVSAPGLWRVGSASRGFGRGRARFVVVGRHSSAELLPREISVGVITDIPAESGFDSSQLSDVEIATLVSFKDGTTREFRSGVTVERTGTDQFGFCAAGATGAGARARVQKTWQRDEQAQRQAQQGTLRSCLL